MDWIYMNRWQKALALVGCGLLTTFVIFFVASIFLNARDQSMFENNCIAGGNRIEHTNDGMTSYCFDYTDERLIGKWPED